MRTTNQETKSLRPSFYALALLALLALPGAARAQWSAPDASGNVNNTNAGNVGVGTGASAPAGKLDVKGATSDASAPALTVRNSTDSNLFFVRNDGRVGIGTTSPAVTFHLSTGATRAEANFQTSHTSGPILRFRLDAGAAADRPLGAVNFLNDAGASLTQMFVAYPGTDNTKTYIRFTTSGAEALRIDSSGNVGIGTQSPTSKLHVVGGAITVQGATAGGGSGNADLAIRTASGNGYWDLATQNTNGSFVLYDVANNKLPVGVEANAPTNTLYLNAAGAVGVGAPPSAGSPYRLEVAGSVGATGLCIGGVCKSSWSEVGGGQWSTDTNGNVNTATGVNNVGVGAANPAEKLTVAGSIVATGSSAIQGSQFIITNNDTTGPWMGVHTDRLGNSTANYAAPRLSMQAAGVFFQFSPATAAGAARTWTTRLAIDSASGNVGIGTSSPGARLDVVQANSPAVRALSGSASAHVNIQVGRTAAEATLGVAAATGQYTTDAAAGDVVLRTEDSTKRFLIANGAGATVLSVSGGKVGVGTATPGAGLTDATVKLDVAGSINVSGNISAKYQDVAEWVPSTQKLAAGTVVVLDTERTNHVVGSKKAYDTGVAGVVSAEPGVILGVGGADRLKVATTGRVRVKVDATRAPIKVGDLLVTSDVEGVAMKSVEVDLGGVKIHRPGTIIGKALEPLSSGAGEILVLLSLQ